MGPQSESFLSRSYIAGIWIFDVFVENADKMLVCVNH